MTLFEKKIFSRRERRCRYALSKLDLCLCKSRTRDTNAANYGGYMIVDASTNIVFAGGDPIPFFLSIDNVEELIKKYS
jgi:hypothetical protein